MKVHLCLGAAVLASAAQVSANPAMSVVTVHTSDPMGYMKWAMESGPAIGEAIDAEMGGVCLATAGFASPGELYYWHLFEDHADAMSASLYDEDVAREVAKLEVERRISAAELYSVAMAPGGGYAVGDSFASWNIFVSTNEPSLYMQQVARIVSAAKENGFDDVNMSAYRTLTGPMAGKGLVAVGMPSSERLGEFIDQLGSDWMAPIMADLAGIREYVMGIAMECTVVHLDD